MIGIIKDLKETATQMCSEDYKERFRAEYHQVNLRFERLKEMVGKWDSGELNFTPTCPRSTYDLQLKAMYDYKSILELRAMAEGIEF